MELNNPIFWASRVAQQSKALLQTRVHSWAVVQPAVSGCPIGRRTIGPASSGLAEGLDCGGGLYLAHRALATPCGRPGACSIKFIIYVKTPPFASAFGKQIQTHRRACKSSGKVGRKVQNVTLQSVETCQTTYRINL
jgi:hypothetical protein